MPPVAPGWAVRLTDVLGAPPSELGEQHLQALVENGVREDADLDFKESRYGNSDQERRDLAGDIAAMANDRGGLIVIGIRDENDVAVEATPVELVDSEEGRLRQTTAGNLAPHVPFEIRVVQASEDPGRGYYLLIVPPSSLRPHAVRHARNLRYPRRDGTTTRWLSEAEVADMYSDRFRLATDQTEQMTGVLEEGLRAIDTSEGAFLVVGHVPTTSGSIAIDLARLQAVVLWASDFGRVHWWRGFFHQTPSARAGARRIRVTTVFAADRPTTRPYAELHTNGCGFAAVRLFDARRRPGEGTGTWVLNEDLLLTVARTLHLLGRHASDNTGAWGDALVEAQVIGTELQLAYLMRADEGDNGPLGEVVARSVRHSIERHVLPALAGPLRLVPLGSLATTDLSRLALLSAAKRNRLRAVRMSDAYYSTRQWVDEYRVSRWRRRPADAA